MKKDVAYLLLKYVSIYLLFAFPMFIFILFSVTSKKACIGYNGFAVDGAGNVYIGRSDEIYVIDSSGSPLSTFDIPPSRGYSFVVTENDQILLRTGEIVFTMDLQGSIIKEEPVSERLIERIPTIQPKKIVAADGTSYTMKTHLLRTIVQAKKGDSISQIYQMPLFDYVVRILFVLYIIGSFISISFIVFRIRHILKR